MKEFGQLEHDPITFQHHYAIFELLKQTEKSATVRQRMIKLLRKKLLDRFNSNLPCIRYPHRLPARLVQS